MDAHQRGKILAQALDRELRENILPFWYQTMDHRRGGFAGLVTFDGKPDMTAPKGLVMHSRHLWASSRAWSDRRNPLDLAAARHAYTYLTGKLQDRIGRGFWWTVDVRGNPETESKVLYGQAFAVYGLAQYYRSTGEAAALDLALEVFGLLESVGRDREFGGYYEAVDRHWKGPLVQALSDVDIPCSKSMNTNLHILEAYTALYLATGQAKVAEALESLLQVFEKHILVSPSHLGLYFDRDWKNLTEQVSYGHDVEASWLMAEAAQALADHGSHPGHLDPVRAEVCLAIARTSLTILKENGGSMPEGIHNGRLDTTRTWWVQAEALVGMVNAWELSGDEAFLTAAESLWAYIDRFVVDRNRGDWHWAVDAQGRPDATRPKGGLWKTSYHNGRACMEVISRVSRWS